MKIIWCLEVLSGLYNFMFYAVWLSTSATMKADALSRNCSTLFQTMAPGKADTTSMADNYGLVSGQFRDAALAPRTKAAYSSGVKASHL